MTLVDKADELLAAVSIRRITYEEAVRQLQQYSDGGLTRLGAADVLENRSANLIPGYKRR